jgi:short chain dehydrogenase
MGDVRFDGRVAIVTGAGGGLGREHALLLASRGAKVVVNDLGGGTDGTGASAGPAERTAKEIEDLGGVAVADASSVATVEGGQAIVDTALDAFGGVDVVISNAGILRDKAFHNLTPELLDPVLDVHLKGAFHVLRPAWVKMREAGYGRVLVTASNAGILGNFGLVAPVAAWLVSEECPVTGEIYSAGGGRVARFFIGLTEGYANPALTLEDVRDHVDEIRDEKGYTVPTGVADEMSALVQRLG